VTKDSDNPDAYIHRICSTLERIAASFPPDSDEASAIADAAAAFIVVRQRQSLAAAWRQLRDAHDGDVPQDVLDRMRNMDMDMDMDELNDTPSG
jgi:hypothetical protein